jgi:type II secretory pathway component GspD/PulD (secretin)
VEYSEGLQKEFGINAGLHRPELQKNGSHSSPSFNSALGAASPNLDLGFSGEGLKKILNDAGGLLSAGSNSVIGKLPDDFFVALHFLESQSKAKVMAQPSIVTLNGNKASINVNETRYIKLTTGTQLGTDYSIRVQPITFGIKLDITPWISQGGQITAEISPEVSNSTGNNLDGYPNVSARTISTTVRLNDGETITLGGLIKNEESEGHEKIPILGDIPLIGRLFRTNTKNRQKTNLVVYVTPHIIKKGNAIDLDSALHNLDMSGSDFIEGKIKETFWKSKSKKDQEQKSVKDTAQTNTLPAPEKPKSEAVEKSKSDSSRQEAAPLNRQNAQPVLKPGNTPPQFPRAAPLHNTPNGIPEQPANNQSVQSDSVYTP